MVDITETLINNSENILKLYQLLGHYVENQKILEKRISDLECRLLIKDINTNIKL